MSEVVEAAATEAAPEAIVEEPSTPVEEVVEQPVESAEPTPPEPARSVAEAKARSRANIREKADAREKERRERARDEQGRFVSEEPAQVEGSVPEAEAAEENAVPDGFVRIELPEGSKLRETRGLEHWDVPEDRADDFRYFVNLEQKERRAQAEWDRLKQENAEKEQRLIQIQAEREFFKENTATRLSDEQKDAIRQDHLQAYGPSIGEEMALAGAEAFISRIEGNDQQALEEARQEALWQAEAQKLEKHATDFRNNVIRYGLYGDGKSQPWFPGWTEAGIEQSLKAYGMYISAEIQSGRDVMPDPKEFFQLFALPAYRKTEAGRQYLDSLTNAQQAKALEEARKQGLTEAQKAEEARLKEAAERHETLPGRGRLPVRKGLAATGATPAPEQTDKTLSPTQLKKQAKDRIRQRFTG